MHSFTTFWRGGLEIIVLIIISIFKSSKFCLGHVDKKYNPKYTCSQIDIEYSTLIFSFIDNVKPKPDQKQKQN